MLVLSWLDTLYCKVDRARPMPSKAAPTHSYTHYWQRYPTLHQRYNSTLPNPTQPNPTQPNPACLRKKVMRVRKSRFVHDP